MKCRNESATPEQRAVPNEEAVQPALFEYNDGMWPLLSNVKRSSAMPGANTASFLPRTGIPSFASASPFHDVYEIGMSYLGFQDSLLSLEESPVRRRGPCLLPVDRP